MRHARGAAWPDARSRAGGNGHIAIREAGGGRSRDQPGYLPGAELRWHAELPSKPRASRIASHVPDYGGGIGGSGAARTGRFQARGPRLQLAADQSAGSMDSLRRPPPCAPDPDFWTGIYAARTSVPPTTGAITVHLFPSSPATLPFPFVDPTIQVNVGAPLSRRPPKPPSRPGVPLPPPH